MKKILLIALLIIPLFGISQTTKPIDSFLGIKFGSSRAQVTAAIKAKGGELKQYTNTRASDIYFANVNLGQRASIQLQVTFIDDKAYLVVFTFNPENDPASLTFYNSLVSDINDVYGKGVSVRNFKSPYADGDGHEILALSAGYATINTTWTSITPAARIQVSIYPNKDELLFVKLIYQDDTLAKTAKMKEKEKEKADL